MKECFRIEDLTFYYPEQKKAALNNISLEVAQGEFLTLCGPSGSGKSTLLRQLKTVLAPHGFKAGKIQFMGSELDLVDQREQCSKIGFVLQSPENQIVTDKVWHELAFGLESLGFESGMIRSRVAEMASYFGIQTWFNMDVADLSGGQKQLLNLASVMTMDPEVLVLDEPTSQLDPIAAEGFLAMLGKINRELGTAIIISEQRLEEVLPLSDRVLVMDGGRIIADGTPAAAGELLKNAGHSMFLAMPTAMRVWAAVADDAPCPVTVREGRNWLENYASTKGLNDSGETGKTFLKLLDNSKDLPKDGATSRPEDGATSRPKDSATGRSKDSATGRPEDGATGLPKDSVTDKSKDDPEEPAIFAEGVWYKYEKNLPDVLKGLTLEVRRGEFFALLGGNGTGKTTALSVIGGIRKAYRGKLRVNGSIGVLPQDPKTLFVKKTVGADLLEMLDIRISPKSKKKNGTEDSATGKNDISDQKRQGRNQERAKQEIRLDQIVKLCKLEELLDRHPYDLSGGEQQRAALAKVLLLEPDILLLDEPTKGLDAEFKQVLATVIRNLTERGMTILIVSHDVEFCAEYADRCALFFDGTIVSQGTAREFFSGNSFYTTAANRMARTVLPNAVTASDIISACCAGVSCSTEFKTKVPVGETGAGDRSAVESLDGETGINDKSKTESSGGKTGVNGKPESDVLITQTGNNGKPDAQAGQAGINGKTESGALEGQIEPPEGCNDCDLSPETPENQENRKSEPHRITEINERSPDFSGKKLPLWRKLIAVISGIAVIVTFVQAVGITDLSSILTSSGMTELSHDYMIMYAVLIGALVVFAVSINRRSEKALDPLKPPEKRRLSKRTIAASVMILLLIPFTLFAGVYCFDSKKYYFIALIILMETMVPFFLVFEKRRPQARELVVIAVLCAIAVAGRAALFMLPGFKPVLALVIIAGVAFGAEAGFLTGALTMLISNVLFGQGPWTPWQMFAMGIAGFLAGLLFKKGLLARNRLSLCVFGGFSAIVIYGGIMNPASALMWMHTLDWKILLTYYITGFPADLVHAFATVLILWFAADPMLEKMDRIKTKYGLLE